MTRRVLLVHNGRILARATCGRSATCWTQHPAAHGDAAGARAAAAGGGDRRLAERAVDQLRRRGRMGDGRDRAARRVLRRPATTRHSSRGGRDVLAGREPGIPSSGTWCAMRDPSRPAAVCGRRPGRLLAIASSGDGLDAPRAVLIRRCYLIAVRVVRARLPHRVWRRRPSCGRSAPQDHHAAGRLHLLLDSAMCCRWRRSSMPPRSLPTRWRGVP